MRFAGTTAIVLAATIPSLPASAEATALTFDLPVRIVYEKVSVEPLRLERSGPLRRVNARPSRIDAVLVVGVLAGTYTEEQKQVDLKDAKDIEQRLRGALRAGPEFPLKVDVRYCQGDPTTLHAELSAQGYERRNRADSPLQSARAVVELQVRSEYESADELGRALAVLRLSHDPIIDAEGRIALQTAVEFESLEATEIAPGALKLEVDDAMLRFHREVRAEAEVILKTLNGTAEAPRVWKLRAEDKQMIALGETTLPKGVRFDAFGRRERLNLTILARVSPMDSIAPVAPEEDEGVEP